MKGKSIDETFYNGAEKIGIEGGQGFCTVT